MDVVIDSLDPVNGPMFSRGAGNANTGTIRLGLGRQRVEWLTIVGAAAWGAKSLTSDVAGTDDVVAIELHGVSARALPASTESTPAERARTNRATIAQ